MPPVLSTERIAHLGTTGDCRAAAFQSSLCRSWVNRDSWAMSAATNVRFSNRPFGVKRFQTIHHYSVDVAHGLVLLFGIGTRGPSIMGFEDEAEQSLPRPYRDGRVQADMRTHLIHRPARDIIPPLGGARVSFYWIRCCTVFMLLLWPVLGSSGTRCRQPICGA